MQRLKASLLPSPCPRGAPRGLFPRLGCDPGKYDCTQSELRVLLHGYKTHCLSCSASIEIWTVFPRENSVIEARRTQGLPVTSSAHKKQFSIIRTPDARDEICICVCQAPLWASHLYEVCCCIITQ